MKHRFDRHETVYLTEICETPIKIVYWEYIASGYEFVVGGYESDWGHGDAIAALLSSYIAVCSMALDCQIVHAWQGWHANSLITINLVNTNDATFYEFLIDSQIVCTERFGAFNLALDAAYEYAENND